MLLCLIKLIIEPQMAEPIDKKRSPGLWIFILYFAEGFPYTVVNLIMGIFFKDLGASNELIGLTSLLSLPWTLKGLWGPMVDLYSTKRRWILITEIVCTFLFVLLALAALSAKVFTFSLCILGAIAFVSATHDIAIDGFYLDVLNKQQQAFYVGLRSTAYKMASLAGIGGLVSLAGDLANKYVIGTSQNGLKTYQDVQFILPGSSLTLKVHPQEFGWAVAFAVASAIFLLIYCFQIWNLPYPQITSTPRDQDTPKINWFDAFKTYFTQYKIGWIVAYILLFRLGDAFMLKMASPFLMDKTEKGGLAISTAEIGKLYGTVGVFFLLIGGIVGGYLIAKQGLKKWMWPMAIIQNSAILLYALLAMYQPSLEWTYMANSFEQLSYGMGVSAYTVFLMRTVRPEYKASHYAITTAFMAAGMLIPGVLSGYLETWMGYQNYFLMSFLASLPGLATLFFLPIEENT